MLQQLRQLPTLAAPITSGLPTIPLNPLFVTSHSVKGSHPHLRTSWKATG